MSSFDASRSHQERPQSRFRNRKGRPRHRARQRRCRIQVEPLEQLLLMATQPFPVPLDPLKPIGSLSFSGSKADRFDAAGETDSFTSRSAWTRGRP